MVITKHALCQANKRFGFSGNDILAIIELNDKLNDEEKALIWLSRPLNRRYSKGDDDYYYSSSSGCCVVVADSYVITVYEAKYIQFERDRKKLSKNVFHIDKLRAKDFIPRVGTEEIYNFYKNGAHIFVKGVQRELFIERDLVGFLLEDDFKPLCHYMIKEVKVMI